MKTRIWIMAMAAVVAMALIFSITPTVQSQQTREYPVVVDYSRTLAEMIEADDYDYVSYDINADNFQISGEGKVKIDIQLVNLNKFASTDEILAELDKRGLRPATLPELLAFNERYNIRLNESAFIIGFIALGSVWSDENDFHSVVSLFLLDNLKYLYCRRYVTAWHKASFFLAVRK